MTVGEFRESFGTVYDRAGRDSAGFDAMESLARDYQDQPLEIVGEIEWQRPFNLKPESRDKPIPDLTYGDLVLDTANTSFVIDWLALEFQPEEKPHVGPGLSEYGLDESLRDAYPLSLPREFILTPDNDTIRDFQVIVVRGRVGVDWERGLRTKYYPLKSIYLKDCQIIEVTQSTR